MAVLFRILDVLELLERHGWIEVVRLDRHRQFKHPRRSGRATIAGMPADAVAPGAWHSVQKRIGLE